MSGRVLFEWPKRGGVTVRVTIADFNGSRFLDIREWIDRDGQPLATRKGATMPLGALQSLYTGVGKELMAEGPDTTFVGLSAVK